MATTDPGSASAPRTTAVTASSRPLRYGRAIVRGLSPSSSQPFIRLLRLTVVQTFHEHGLLSVVVLLHIGFAYLASRAGVTDILAYPLFSMKFTIGVAKLSIWIPLVSLLSECWCGRRRGFAYAIKTWRIHYLNLRTLAGVVIGALLIAHAMIAHDTWKRMIGLATPYSWDARLAAFDRTLHFGFDPWRILHELLKPVALTAAIDTLYWLWFPLAATGISWMLWTRHRALRTRLLLAWSLTWLILGTVVAHFVASGGPFAYGHLATGPNPFQPLMDHLRYVDSIEPLVALQLQGEVWANVVSGGDSQWYAMSAMPSLHVAVPVLYALGIGMKWRKLGAALWAFALLTLVGSIYLGWHYGVDGYVSVIGVVVIWRLVHFLLRSKPIPDGRFFSNLD